MAGYLASWGILAAMGANLMGVGGMSLIYGDNDVDQFDGLSPKEDRRGFYQVVGRAGVQAIKRRPDYSRAIGLAGLLMFAFLTGTGAVYWLDRLADWIASK